MPRKNNEAVTSFSVRSRDAIEAALSVFAYIYAAASCPLPRPPARSAPHWRIKGTEDIMQLRPGELMRKCIDNIHFNAQIFIFRTK